MNPEGAERNRSGPTGYALIIDTKKTLEFNRM